MSCSSQGLLPLLSLTYDSESLSFHTSFFWNTLLKLSDDFSTPFNPPFYPVLDIILNECSSYSTGNLGSPSVALSEFPCPILKFSHILWYFIKLTACFPRFHFGKCSINYSLSGICLCFTCLLLINSSGNPCPFIQSHSWAKNAHSPQIFYLSQIVTLLLYINSQR